MHYEIEENGDLTIIAEKEDRHALLELMMSCQVEGDNWHGDSAMIDALESLICNSDLEWIQPYEVGALTSAPILAIRDGEDPDVILNCWGFMGYAFESVQNKLLIEGSCTFIAGSKD